MIEEIISSLFRRIGHTWRIGNRHDFPTENDVRRTLDYAAKRLYDSEVDTRLEVGGIIIDKRPSGHDVYVYVGNYE